MRGLAVAALVCALAWPGAAEAQLQSLGHRLPAGVGMDAGTQAEQGVYIGDRLVWFAIDEVHDRNGDALPIQNLQSNAYANAFGIAATKRVGAIYLSAAFAIPVARVRLAAAVPEASVDRLGLGNVFVEPVQVGHRSTRFDAIASYSLYAPTSQLERSGVGRAQWSHQIAAGSTLFFDDARGWRLSGLASYVINNKKRDIDITRGDLVLVQGGAGGPLRHGLELGIAGYALWQVTDDRGGDLPPVLRGARERAFGLGPELDLTLPPLRSRLTARLTWDLDGKARPVGTIFLVGVSVVAWR